LTHSEGANVWGAPEWEHSPRNGSRTGRASLAVGPVDLPGEASTTGAEATVSPCRSRLAEIASFKPLPPIAGPEDCTATDVVALDAVLSADGHRIALSPTAALRCPMAEAVTHWIREDVAPTIAAMGKSLRGVETLDSFACRRRNGVKDAKNQ